MFALPRAFAAVALVALTGSLFADGPADNLVDNVRPIPPKGNPVLAEDAADIKKGLAELQRLIKDIGKHELLPDVLIFEKAVRWALEYDEVYDGPTAKSKGKAAPAGTNVKKVLAAGLDRAKALKAGNAPWATQTGGVLRGYTSKIDGSVQPYWLIVPADYDFKAEKKHRLDFWWHGRGETLSEAQFMANSPGAGGGIIPAPGALILHPYGRYCNANKFAGEIDTFECLEHAKKHYRIDESRLVARGFSMGGAACWQFGVHYPTLWAACAPGAGFSETPEFLKVFQNEKVEPTWYEKKLWHLYNATDYCQNLFNLPTVAYSGEIDSQKQAADVMAREMKKVGLELKHVIGPKTGHSYEKDAKIEVNKLIDAIVEKGLPAGPRSELKFTTYTLRYNKCDWVTVTGMGKHWEPARVTATFKGGWFDLKTENVTALHISIPVGKPFIYTGVKIDGHTVHYIGGNEVKGFDTHFVKGEKEWAIDVRGTGAGGKYHGMQGPIDDAFLSAFLNVSPTGKPLNEKVGAWAAKEMKHASDHWRKQFRGDAPTKKDTEITDADIANNNLVLWGDARSNAVLAKIADKLPAKWVTKKVNEGGQEVEVTMLVLGDREYPADTHVPVLIFPNPLNPSKYAVLNSGFTFREYDQLNNARQVPKLPDYAVLDVTTPANSRYPGKVVRAGFFGEKWELQKDDGK